MNNSQDKKHTPPAWRDRVDALLDEQGLGREDLTDVFGVQEGGVGHYFTGRNKTRDTQLYMLSKKLGVSMEYLMTGHDSDEDLPEKVKEGVRLLKVAPPDVVDPFVDILRRSIRGEDRSR